MDGDLQDDPKEIPAFLSALTEDVDLVSRLEEESPGSAQQDPAVAHLQRRHLLRERDSPA